MRILLDDCGYSWEKLGILFQILFAYTNHTVMAEALEKWDVNLVKRIVPRIYTIIEIYNRYCQMLIDIMAGITVKLLGCPLLRITRFIWLQFGRSMP